MFVCLIAGVVLFACYYFGEPLLLELNERELMLVGIGAFIVLTIFPFALPPDEGLKIYRRFELSIILGGAMIAVVTAVFLLQEYEDQRQARITRAWDLLHKARTEAYRRMDQAEQEAREHGDVALQEAEKALKDCETKKTGQPDCSTEKRELAKKRWEVRRTARGNNGQIGALHTLAQGSTERLSEVSLDELFLKSLQLPSQQLIAASFRYANLENANLENAT